MSPSDTSHTFRGLVPLRLAFAACALVVMYMGVALPWLGPDDQPNDTLGEYALLGGLMTASLLVGAAALAICLERVVVDDDGVHRRNLIWIDRSTPWDQILGADLDTDAHNTHPVLTTSGGKIVRLRGAASLVDSPRSVAVRAHKAIEARLL